MVVVALVDRRRRSIVHESADQSSVLRHFIDVVVVVVVVLVRALAAGCSRGRLPRHCAAASGTPGDSVDAPGALVAVCYRVSDLRSGCCRFESRPGLVRTKVYSAFHPPGVGK